MCGIDRILNRHGVDDVGIGDCAEVADVEIVLRGRDSADGSKTNEKTEDSGAGHKSEAVGI